MHPHHPHVCCLSVPVLASSECVTVCVCLRESESTQLLPSSAETGLPVCVCFVCLCPSGPLPASSSLPSPESSEGPSERAGRYCLSPLAMGPGEGCVCVCVLCGDHGDWSQNMVPPQSSPSCGAQVTSSCAAAACFSVNARKKIEHEAGSKTEGKKAGERERQME